MYLPPLYAATDSTVLFDFVDQYNFGTLICQDGTAPPEISHLPFVLDRTDGPNGTLWGHAAKANPICRFFDESATATVIFNGPHGYISPRWYSSRQEVPTWNYAVVHLRGQPSRVDHSRLSAILDDLVRKHEGHDPSPWNIGELDERSFNGLTQHIVGFKIPIESIAGKFKLGQNRGVEDRAGAIDGLRKRNYPLDLLLAEMMASTIEDG